MRLLSKILLLVLAVLTMTACQLTERSAQDILWPDLNDPYVQSTKDWTRRVAIYDGVNLSFAVTSTAKSLEWRESFAQRYAEVYSLKSGEALEAQDSQRVAHAAHTEFVLALESPTLKVNALSARNEQWKVFALQGENKLYPLEIRRLKSKAWPDSKLKAFFPYYNRWQTFYSVVFERVAPGPLKLVVSGPAGRVELGWEEFE